MPTPGLVQRFLQGELVLDDFLKRIAEREPQLHCWVQVRPEESATEGPLAGLPYGAKDIIETAGYLTGYGSQVYAGHVSTEDASIIRVLRARGARLLGKTQTTAFAYYDPAPTRNPHQPSHTPGGSSSGSAAAVAAGMTPLALGSQTQGSVIRPASFCGVVGFKPTYGVLPLVGVMPFAPALDTLGLFTQTAMDLRLVWEGLGFAVDAELPAEYAWFELDVDAEMDEILRETVVRLGSYGCRIRRVEPPPVFLELMDAVPWVNKYEGARTHEKHYRDHGSAIGVKLAQLVRDGLAIPESRYQDALSVFQQARQEMAELFQTFPVILSAAAPGPAPSGLGFTGDPRCNAPWTALGVPACTIPMPVYTGSLPMGLQMTAASNQDAALIAAATHFQALLTAQADLELN
ncbi:MAG: amidase [Bryobacteraceae bacterium]|nr:amidase [Bryobacteraceae bacterium]